MCNHPNRGTLGIPQNSRIPSNTGIQTRTTPRPPRTTGLKAKQPSTANLNHKVLQYAKSKLRKRVGSGECYDLADKALNKAKAKSAPDYGRITATADYVWGKKITYTDAKPGDIIQFVNYRYDQKIEQDDGSYETSWDTRPHHTAIVESVGENGAITVLEQNVPARKPVRSTKLYFANNVQSANGTTTTITVKGKFWFYRPQARETKESP